MDLLIAILFALGFHYNPDQITTLQSSPTNDDYQVEFATYIRDNNLYHYSADGGIVIEDGVNP